MEAARIARARAHRFVEVHGDALLGAVAAALAGAAPASAAVEQVAARQQPGGAFALGGGGGPVAETRRALSLLADLGALSAPAVARACAWLEAAQAPDGSWGDLPDETVRLVETGLVLASLARTPWVRARSLGAAADHLAAHWSPERVQGLAWATLGAYAASFSSLDHERSDEVLQWCGRELERGFRSGGFDAVRTARVLAWCDAPSLPGARLAAAEVVAGLLAEQAPDGGWLAPDAPAPERVLHSLDALAGLAHLAG